MKWNFKSESCFSGVLGYPGLAVVGELSFDVTKWHWFLLLMFLHLPLAIWLSLVLIVLAVSDYPSCEPGYGRCYDGVWSSSSAPGTIAGWK